MFKQNTFLDFYISTYLIKGSETLKSKKSVLFLNFYVILNTHVNMTSGFIIYELKYEC